MAIIIDGKELAQEIRNDLKIKCSELKEKGIKPKLAVILVGDDKASRIYIINKSKACQEVGVACEEYVLKKDTTQKEL